MRGWAPSESSEREEFEAVAEGVAAEEAFAALDWDGLFELHTGRCEALVQSAEVFDEEGWVPAAGVWLGVRVGVKEDVELAVSAAVPDATAARGGEGFGARHRLQAGGRRREEARF